MTLYARLALSSCLAAFSAAAPAFAQQRPSGGASTFSGSRGLSEDSLNESFLLGGWVKRLTPGEYQALAEDERRNYAREAIEAANRRARDLEERRKRGERLSNDAQVQENWKYDERIRAKGIELVAARLPESRRAFYVSNAAPYMRLQRWAHDRGGEYRVAAADAVLRIDAIIKGAASEEELLKSGIRLELKPGWWRRLVDDLRD